MGKPVQSMDNMNIKETIKVTKYAENSVDISQEISTLF